MALILAAAGVAGVVGIAAYWLGLLDRPPFVLHETLVSGGGDSDGKKELYAIVVTSTDKNIGKVFCSLCDKLWKGMEAAIPDSHAMMQAGAQLYGIPKESPNVKDLVVGLYFDDPKTTDHPRWAAGAFFHAASFADVQKFVPAVQEASGFVPVADSSPNKNTTNTIRAVRLGRDHVLKATIPWRHPLTPWVGAMLHWDRAFRALDHSVPPESRGADASEPIAMEVYFHDPKGKSQIDYVVMFGNIKNVWEDVWPSDTTTKSATAS